MDDFEFERCELMELVELLLLVFVDEELTLRLLPPELPTLDMMLSYTLYLSSE